MIKKSPLIIKDLLKDVSKKKINRLPERTVKCQITQKFIHPSFRNIPKIGKVSTKNRTLMDDFRSIRKFIQKHNNLPNKKHTRVDKVTADHKTLKDELNFIWSNIRNFKQVLKKKLTEIAQQKVGNKTLQDHFILVWKKIYKIGWNDREFVERAAVIGGLVGIILQGFGGSGIVILGSVIELPFILVTVLSGTLVGISIKGLKKEEIS